MFDRRYRELVQRQLDVFVADEHELLHAHAQAEDVYGKAGSGQAEESYADVAELLDAIAERLHDMREAYASTLEGADAYRYRSRFDRAVDQRVPRAAAAYRALAAEDELD
jgi:hypothetical protein